MGENDSWILYIVIRKYDCYFLLDNYCRFFQIVRKGLRMISLVKKAC